MKKRAFEKKKERWERDRENNRKWRITDSVKLGNILNFFEFLVSSLYLRKGLDEAINTRE